MLADTGNRLVAERSPLGLIMADKHILLKMISWNILGKYPLSAFNRELSNTVKPSFTDTRLIRTSKWGFFFGGGGGGKGGIQNNLKILSSARVSRPRTSASKN